jgi:hypothetical protein
MGYSHFGSCVTVLTSLGRLIVDKKITPLTLRGAHPCPGALLLYGPVASGFRLDAGQYRAMLGSRQSQHIDALIRRRAIGLTLYV